jgi:tetratricopeptide (TPR) repeat protein
MSLRSYGVAFWLGLTCTASTFAQAPPPGMIDPLFEHRCNAIADFALAQAPKEVQRERLQSLDGNYHRGLALLAAGRAQEALSELLTYISGIRRHVAPTHHLYLDAVHHTILARSNLGDYGPALADAETNYKVRLSCYGADDRFVLQSLTVLARLYQSTGQVERALEAGELVLAAQARLLASTSPEEADPVTSPKELTKARWNVAAAAFRLRQFDRAATVARETIKSAQTLEADDPERYELANSAWYVLNRIGQREGQPDQKENLAGLDASYRGLRTLLGQGHPRTFPLLANLGFAMADVDAAGAVPILGDYVALVERERLRMRRPTDRQVLLETSGGAYQRFAFAAAQAGKPLDAFYGIEWSKARALRDAFSFRLALADQTLPKETATALKTAEAKVSSLEGQLEEDIRNEAKRQVLAAELQAAKTAFAALFDKAVAESNRFGLAAQSRIQNPTNVSSVLRPDEVFISYLTRRVDGPLLEVLVAILEPSGQLTLFLLGEIAGLESTATAYLEVLAHADGAAGVAKGGSELWQFRSAFFFAPGDSNFPGAEIVTSVEPIRSELSVRLLPKPVRSVLAPYRRWVISPSGPLWSIPFETLQEDDGLVVDRRVVRYVHSWTMLSSLVEATRRDQRTGLAPLLVIGGAKYSDYTPPAGASGTQFTQWKDLPFSSREIALVTNRFKLTEGTTLFRGPSAIPKTMIDLDASGQLANAKMVLLSGHGYLDDVNSAQSALVLGLPKGGTEPDRYLRARDLALFNMPAHLVMVSSCHSGRGRVASGEGVLGLPFSLFAAGALDTIVTRWAVYDDPATATLVSEVLTAVDSGRDPAEALTEIKRKLKETKSEAYWAAFTLLGR